jgi:hypothetical protein
MIKRTNTTEKFFLASKYSEIASLKQLLTNSELVIHLTQLIHQLQRERGMSNLFLASKGERSGDARSKQIAVSENMECRFRELLDQLDIEKISHTHSAKFFNNIAFALHTLDGLPSLRDQVGRQAVTADISCQHYTHQVAALLSVIFEAADLADDPVITRALVAMFNFMQCKEYAGQERALAAIGFAAGTFEQDDLDRIAGLIEAQQSSLVTFREFAVDSHVAYWEKIEQSDKHEEFQRLRLVISRIEAGKTVTSEISEVWYEIATHRMDAMHELESELSTALKDLCQHRIDQADKELKKHHDRLQMLASLHDPTTTHVPPLLDAGFTQNADSGNPPDMASDWVRTLYGLVQQQAESLRNMSDELSEARKALAERKSIERAKGLLMQYHGMSEAQAHRKLQQSAMNQKVALIDVANRVIAEFEKLKEAL